MSSRLLRTSHLVFVVFWDFVPEYGLPQIVNPAVISNLFHPLDNTSHLGTYYRDKDNALGLLESSQIKTLGKMTLQLRNVSHMMQRMNARRGAGFSRTR